MSDSNLSPYCPSVYFFRAELRDSDDPDVLREIALTLCLELEEQKAFIRDHGLIPPKRHIMRSEILAKGWDAEA